MFPDDHLENNICIIRWPYLHHPTEQEPPDLDVLRLQKLLNKKTSDQETTQNKEEVNAHPADPLPHKVKTKCNRVMHLYAVEVEFHHGQDRDTTGVLFALGVTASGACLFFSARLSELSMVATLALASMNSTVS
jgi:hypothetical protein